MIVLVLRKEYSNLETIPLIYNLYFRKLFDGTQDFFKMLN